uniref:Uncharacterized protein n=1 Tax=Aegilops tauschii subsp. strangulata TaxID=200361 RepID=A0A453RZR2_AEGTS
MDRCTGAELLLGTRRSREALGCEAAGQCRDGAAPATLKKAPRRHLHPQVLLPKIHPFFSLVQSGLLIPSRGVSHRFTGCSLDRFFLWILWVAKCSLGMDLTLMKHFLDRTCDFDRIFYEFCENLCYIACFSNSFSSS